VLPTRVFPLLSPAQPCPVCEDPSPSVLHVYPVNHGKPRATSQLNVALLGCASCGIVYSFPRPSAEDLTAYYTRSDGWDDRITEDETEALQRVQKLRSKHAADLDRLAAVVDLPTADDETRPRALDFGCGVGGWLSALSDRGWETYGIEPGRRAAAIAAREHELLYTPPGDSSLDLVVLHHTLEHLPDPAATVADLTASLRPGGAIWISVPNLETLGEHRDLDYMASDKHVFTFTTASLRALLALAGVELVASSMEPSSAVAAPNPKRLICVGVRRGAPLPLPAEPLEPALAALAAYGAGCSEPERRPPPSRLRYLARRFRG